MYRRTSKKQSVLQIVARGALLLELAASVVAGSGNYLIITAPDYAGSAPLNQFAAAKTAMGFTVSVYMVPAGTSRTAIKDHILGLWGTPQAPKYILLVGDTDGDTSGTATIPHWVGGGSRNAATDLPYACMDPGDDWYPEIFIGRFSVRTVQQLQDVVNKSLYVEAGNYPDPNYVKRAAMLASSDSTTQSEQLHDWIISTYLEPAGFTATRIYANQGGNTPEITAAVNNGCLFVTYFGHSGSTGWSSPTFGQPNVNALANNGLYGLVMGWSCNTANYPTNECFGETWLRKPNGGAAAYLSASNYVWWGSVEVWESSRRMERYFYQSFFQDNIWEVRPAWHAALWRLLADPDFGPTHDHTRNIFEEFVLLGDPALLLPRGVAFALTATPTSQDLCSPPATQAIYSVAVESFMGFAEPVTLSATGLPTGASAQFDLNSLAPPFTAQLTISGITPGSAGTYDVLITGTTATLTRNTSVGLNVSNGSPAGVTLLMPPNGAVEVLRTPTLTWEPVPQGLTYDLQIARDLGFTNVAYSATATGPTHTVTSYLDAQTTYYWHVRAVNACGIGAYSAPFSFTTSPQRDYFTELFVPEAHAFDLDGRTLGLVPDGSESCYDFCIVPITALPSNPAGGTPLTLGDDSSVQVTPSQPVLLYGVSYSTFWISSNGYVTFGGGDGTFVESFQAHFSQPRVSALFDDLNPAAGGTVSWKEYANRVVVTWQNVPEYGTTNINTFQIELFTSGEIHLSWLGVAVRDCLTGVSAGHGIPGDFVELDLSAAGTCTWAEFTLAATPTAQSICAPANAVYQIEVSQNLGFNEPVTLSATGLPPGTSVGFSVNPAVPPFTSVMTISNTAAAPPGDYTLQVLGDASSMQRYVNVGLGLATGVPPTVVLTSPADGQTDVNWTPTLTWQAAAQAATYELQVATDANFTQVVYSHSTSGTSDTLQNSLQPFTVYYWHVRGVNACGNGAFSATFHFTTIDQPDYFTELFAPSSGTWDLQNYTVHFISDGGGSYYRACGFAVTNLPTDPNGGTALALSDDTYVQITPSQPVALYAHPYSSFYVCSNGYITFTAGDGTYNESLAAHFNQPRVSALFDDLNPGTGGSVSWKQTADRVAVTWRNVPEYGTTNSNTFQVELLASGAIHITWLNIASVDGLAGLSAGLGVPPDFQETDLSTVGGCTGDTNCDDMVDFDDINPFVLALSDPAGYASAYPNCNILSADCNGDGFVDFDDINPFVAILSTRWHKYDDVL
jgi:predicted small integral membrane protein